MRESEDSTPEPVDAAAALEELIFDEFEVGSALPAESELARRLHVSRLTVREAIRSLQARGLVRIRKGRRPVVTSPDSSNMGDLFGTLVRRNPGSVFELLEVRRGLEVQISSVAADRAGTGDIAALELAVDAMRHAETAEQYHDADLRFHQLLARCCGNRMLALMIDALAESLRTSMIASYRGHRDLGDASTDAVEEHQAILDRVRQGDATRAAAAMREHLRHTERDLRAGFTTVRPEAIE